MGKFLVVIGLFIALLGGLIWSGLGRGWLGHLPGDIAAEKGPVRFYFPWVTCIIISVLLSVFLWIWRRLF